VKFRKFIVTSTVILFNTLCNLIKHKLVGFILSLLRLDILLYSSSAFQVQYFKFVCLKGSKMKITPRIRTYQRVNRRVAQVEPGFDSLAESDQKTLKVGIHSFLA